MSNCVDLHLKVLCSFTQTIIVEESPVVQDFKPILLFNHAFVSYGSSKVLTILRHQYLSILIYLKKKNMEYLFLYILFNPLILYIALYLL